MKRPRPKAKSASNRALRSVIDEIMSKTEPGERVIVPVQRLLEVAYRRMADELVRREGADRRGAVAATEAREEGRAEVRAMWDEIDAGLEGPKTQRAAIILRRFRARLQRDDPDSPFLDPGVRWPTKRAIYDHLRRRDRAGKLR